MVMVHVGEEVDGIRIILDDGILQDTKGMKLVAERALPDNKLSCVGAVQAIDAVGSRYAILDANGRYMAIAVVEEPGRRYDVLSDALKGTNDILLAVLAARDMSQARCIIFFSSGRNWFR